MEDAVCTIVLWSLPLHVDCLRSSVVFRLDRCVSEVHVPAVAILSCVNIQFFQLDIGG